jgi:pimeloyl-ACP methyl ester carboxylesterase
LTGLTKEGYTTFGMAHDLKSLLDGLGIDKFMAIGHSFGGAVLTHFALLWPERIRAFVMLDSGFAALRYLRIIEGWSGWENRPSDMKEGGLTLERFLELDSKQDITDFLRHGLNVPRRGGFRKGSSGMTPRLQRLVEETNLGYEFRDVAGLTEDLIKTVKTPMLALYGETSPYQKMAAHLQSILPNCVNSVIQGSGHFYAVFQPDLVVGRSLPFLRDPEGFVRQHKTATPLDSTALEPAPEAVLEPTVKAAEPTSN